MEMHNRNNEEPLDCDNCTSDICVVECEFEVGLDSMARSVETADLEHRIVRSVKTIIDETESAEYSEARCKTILSETLKVLSGKDYENVAKRITEGNKFLVKMLPVEK